MHTDTAAGHKVSDLKNLILPALYISGTELKSAKIASSKYLLVPNEQESNNDKVWATQLSWSDLEFKTSLFWFETQTVFICFFLISSEINFINVSFWDTLTYGISEMKYLPCDPSSYWLK